METERGQERHRLSVKKSRKSPARPRRSRPTGAESRALPAAVPNRAPGSVTVALGSPPSVRAQRAVASVMFADLRGLTHLAGRLQPQRVVALLDDFLSAMTDVAVGYRAAIYRMIGDALVLVFGVPGPRADDAVRALRSGLDMQRAFLGLHNRWLQQGRREASTLGLRVGIATGNLMVAAIDLAERSDYTVMGETCDRAGALCGASRQADVLIDQTTYDRVAARLESQVVFTSTALDLGPAAGKAAYRCQLRRSGLQVVPRAAQIDPVCRIEVNPHTALRRRVHEQMYYFCSRSCAERFAGDPAAFLGR